MASLTVKTPPDFQFTTTLESHGWLQLAPFEYAEDLSKLAWVQPLGAQVVRIEASPSPGGIRITLPAVVGRLSASSRNVIRESVRRVFNLNLDLAPFYARMSHVPAYAWVAERGAGRLLRSATVWEDLVKTLFTTNTTWAATRGMVRRTSELGPTDADWRHAFPPAGRLAEFSAAELAKRINAGYRSDYLHQLARRIASGELNVEAWDASGSSADELYLQITDLNGFGPYAASVMLKLLGHFDRLTIDTAGRAMFAEKHNHGERAADAEIERHYEPYGQWRGLVMWMDLMH